MMDDPRCLAPLETPYNFLECFKFVFKLDALILFAIRYNPDLKTRFGMTQRIKRRIEDYYRRWMRKSRVRFPVGPIWK